MSELNVQGGPLVDTGPGTGPVILGVNWTFTSLAIIAVAMRMWLRKNVGFGLDDWLMLVAAALMVVFEAILTTSITWGLGRKYESITMDQYKNIQYYQILSQFFLNLQPVMSRWSIAVFLIRIFGKVRPWFKYFLIIWVTLMAIGAVLANVFTFTLLDPLEAWWNPTLESRYRFNPAAQYYTAVGVCWQAAISDLAFAIFPVVFIWKLQMELRKKIGLIALLSGSLVAFLAALAKIIFSTMNIRGEVGEADGPTTGGVLWITSGIEQGLVIILGSAPSLGPLAHMHFVNNIYASLVYLVTFGRRSRRSSRTQSAYNEEEVELGAPRRLPEDDGGSERVAARFADGTAASTVDDSTAKYIKRTDEFVLVHKPSQGQMS